MTDRDFDKAALRGEPSYIWRAGQERRLKLILEAANERLSGTLLENGCGVGMYIKHLAPYSGKIIGLEYDFPRARKALEISNNILGAAGEYLPFPDNSFDIILSHEVIEHVQDDRLAVSEMVRALKKGGRIILFCPNRGYPFETHGIYRKGQYKFGNIPLINYLPRHLRDRLAPHVRIYTTHDLELLFSELPVRYITRKIIFGAYDNIIARYPTIGKNLRLLLQSMENTPLRFFGLSHFWVIEKTNHN